MNLFFAEIRNNNRLKSFISTNNFLFNFKIHAIIDGDLNV